MPEWIIRPATLDDRDEAVALMDRAFGPDEHRSALWDWAFADNPYADELYYLVADTGSALAAQYATMPVAMQHDGRPVRGLISLFTATDPAFQHRGLFRTLAQTLYDRTRERFPIVYGFPNHRSARGFYKHLDWVDLRPYPSLRRPLRNGARHADGTRAAEVAARLLDAGARVGRDPTLEIVEIAAFDGTANQVWEQLRPRIATAVIRDETFLNWRFVRSPFAYQRFLALRDGRPVGLAVLAAESGDGKARLMELMIAPSEKAAVARTLLAHVIERATALGAFGLGFIATRRHPQYRQLIAAGLIPNLRLAAEPSPIDKPINSFGARVNGPGVTPSRLLHIDDWYLSTADQDWL